MMRLSLTRILNVVDIHSKPNPNNGTKDRCHPSLTPCLFSRTTTRPVSGGRLVLEPNLTITLGRNGPRVKVKQVMICGRFAVIPPQSWAYAELCRLDCRATRDAVFLRGVNHSRGTKG